MNKLSFYSEFVEEQVKVTMLSIKNYIGVDNLLPNRGGIKDSEYLPSEGKAILFRKGDILIGNIRPYFKKIWLATFDGGCSSDVLCVRSKGIISSEFLYSVLSQDSFFDYDMAGSKGSKMPRGDKNHIMNYPIPDVNNRDAVAKLVLSIDKKINTNNRINDNLQQLAKTIYDYWFLQFDFPNSDNKPYKSSGGKMVWNEELKKEIPTDWKVVELRTMLKKITRTFDYSNNVPTIDLSVMQADTIPINKFNDSSNFSTNLFELKKR